MLQVQSFKIDDADGMNKLLKHQLIAPGANILVSDGKVCIPYEDGLQLSDNQLKINNKEERNKIKREVGVVEHSQRTLLAKINGAKDQYNVQQKSLKESEEKTSNGTKVSKEVRDHKKMLEGELKRLDNVIAQFENSMVSNQAMITDKMIDIQIYEEEFMKIGSDVAVNDPLQDEELKTA